MTENSARGADLLVEMLAQSGVSHIFGLAGTTLLSILDALVDRGGIAYIGCRHEQAVASAADGYARATRKIGVGLVHVGPGAANALVGVACAFRDGVPLLLISGNEDAKLLGRDIYHEMDSQQIFRSVTKWTTRVERVEELPRILRTALIRATSGRPGPVHIDLPKDIAKAVFPTENETLAEVARRHLGFLSGGLAVAPLFRPGPAPGEVSQALSLLADAHRPLIYVGGGIYRADAQEALGQFVALTGIPVVVTDSGRGALPNDHPLYLGVGGRAREEGANQVVQAADVILALGCRFSNITTNNFSLVSPRARILQVDIEPDQLGTQYPLALAIQADLRQFLQESLAHLAGQEWQSNGAWELDSLKVRYNQELAAFMNAPGSGQGARGTQLIKQLVELVPGPAYITGDPGLTRYYTEHFYLRVNQRYVSAAGFGSMGFSLPAAMGLKVGDPGRTVIATMGDGSFAMVSQELETVARHNIGVKIIVMNNNCFGSQKLQQVRGYGSRHLGVDHTNPDYAQLASLYGLPSYRVEKDADLQPALSRAFAEPGPALVEVLIDTSQVPQKWNQG